MIAECDEHHLHLCDDFACHEIVNVRDDADGERVGELVGTGLYNYAMPLIRYRTRDEVILNANQHECSCGRPLPVINAILGKQCDYIETPDGRLLGAVMSHSIDNATGVVMSQCVQEARDHLYVNLVVDDRFSDDSRAALERDLRKRLGKELKIEFRLVPQLEKRPGGKTPFILSKIGNIYQ
jgi:phenylacetate-CoA ligase